MVQVDRESTVARQLDHPEVRGDLGLDGQFRQACAYPFSPREELLAGVDKVLGSAGCRGHLCSETVIASDGPLEVIGLRHAAPPSCGRFSWRAASSFSRRTAICRRASVISVAMISPSRWPSGPVTAL